MQHHLFTGVGNGVGISFITALADKIAFVVVAGEKGEQMREDGVFMLGGTGAIVGNLLAQGKHGGNSIRLHAVSNVLHLLLFQLCMKGGNGCGSGRGKVFIYLEFETIVKIVVDLNHPRIENAINTKIQLRPVDLEYLFQLFYQLFVFAHGVSVE